MVAKGEKGTKVSMPPVCLLEIDGEVTNTYLLGTRSYQRMVDLLLTQEVLAELSLSDRTVEHG